MEDPSEEAFFLPVNLSPGKIIGESFKIYFSHFVSFTLISLLAFSPMIGWLAFLLSKISSAGIHVLDMKELTYYNYGITGATFVLQPIAAGAIIYGVFRSKKGEKVSLGKCLAVSFGRILPILGVTGAVLIAAVGVTIPLLVLAALLAPGFLFLGPVLVLAAFVPALILICTTYVAVPATVVEKIGVFASLKRSSKMVRGNRGRILFIILMLFLAHFLINLLLDGLMLNENRISSVEQLLTNLRIFLITTLITTVTFTALTASASAFAYFQIKVGSEGMDQDQLASVFD